MSDLIYALLDLLQKSPLGEAVRSAQYIYAALEAGHILGLGLLIGPAFAFDLRLLGFGSRLVPVTAAARYLLPLSHIGLFVTVVTGLGLLSAQATMVAAAAAAPWKLFLLILACLNVLVFHFGIYRSVTLWEDDRPAPTAACIGALVSLLAWSGVITAGQLLAYT